MRTDKKKLIASSRPPYDPSQQSFCSYTELLLGKAPYYDGRQTVESGRQRARTRAIVGIVDVLFHAVSVHVKEAFHVNGHETSGKLLNLLTFHDFAT